MNFLQAKWSNLVMANYEVDPEILMSYLPRGTTLDSYQGKVYVSLVGFMFLGTRIFGLPIPGLGTFEEINLRFYVLRKEGDNIKRGVVFINETVPYKGVAWIANKLYKEHYTAIPTRHKWTISVDAKQIDYYWKISAGWDHIKVKASGRALPMGVDSIEEFIFEHYYGYTRVSEKETEEYQIEHARWLVNPIEDYLIKCDFAGMYGQQFGFLSDERPASVMLAEGSPVAVKWQRIKLYP